MSDFTGFGRFLSQQRELRGMSRDDVARATKIPPTLLAALEEGQSERLPERIFVQNYIRAYAQVVGLSTDEALNRWHEIPGTAIDAETPPQVLEKARRKRAWVAVVILLAVAVVAGCGLWWWTVSEQQRQAHSSH